MSNDGNSYYDYHKARAYFMQHAQDVGFSEEQLEFLFEFIYWPLIEKKVL